MKKNNLFDKTIWKCFSLTPAQTISLSFLSLILMGAILLNLPISNNHEEPVGFLNALFTATSAVCVTGLAVVNTLEQWTLFGKIIILALIQLGALGFMTVLTVVMLALRKRISLKDRLIIQASYNQSSIGGMVQLIKQVVIYTILIEISGAVLLTICFGLTDSLSFREALWNGIFHAISAFCNAGFDIIGAESFSTYQGNVPINIVIMTLIILGGLGFTVLAEIGQLIRNRKTKSFRLLLKHLSLHTKIALFTTIVLILSAMLLFLILEWQNPETLGTLSRGRKVLGALFQSVTLRTAGFSTINQAGLTEESLFISCLYMLIGGSPAGTAGGMKTVTFGVIVIAMISVLRGRERMEAFGRTLPLDLLLKALTVACAVCTVVLISTLLLCFTESGNSFDYTFLDLLFECSSAAGTAGITTGITPHLSSAGKMVIIICMFLGRLSPVTVVVALNMKLHAGDKDIAYIEERVIIG